MDRKKFIRNSSLAGLFFNQWSQKVSYPSAEINSREGNKGIFYGEYDEATIDQLQVALSSGKITSVNLVDYYVNRINRIDKSGPIYLNSILEINPDAIAIASELDKERRTGKTRGILHGIPILVKDNINTKDKMMTTAGALAMVGNYASKDAFIIHQLRQAGAIILGKTNLSEWANFRSTQSTSGWSSRGKQTLCPYVLDRNPSGSSAGSGAAIAANLAMLGIGTETNGSIVSPSSINGLVGIKPTVGLWSRSGIIPISETQDTAGPMARTVKDATILLGALTGLDTEDPKTMDSESKFKTDYTQYLKEDGLKGKKIGVEKSHLTGNNAVVSLFKNALDQVKTLGATIVEVDILKSLEKASSVENIFLQYQFKEGLNRYLTINPGPMKSLKDIIDYNNHHIDSTMPYFGQEILSASEALGTLKDQAYLDALKSILSSKDILMNLKKENGLDAFCGVTNGLACCIDLVNGDYDTGFSLSTPAAIAGFPHITVPMGQVDELPIGLSFFAGAFEEPLIIGMAYAYEQATQHRKAPKFLSRIGY